VIAVAVSVWVCIASEVTTPPWQSGADRSNAVSSVRTVDISLLFGKTVVTVPTPRIVLPSRAMTVAR
jgi:hypothetical protein